MNKFNGMSLTLCAVLVLASCGKGGGVNDPRVDDEDPATHVFAVTPISMLLRPGESETIEYVGPDAKQIKSLSINAPDVSGLDQPIECNAPANDCRAFKLTAAQGAPSNPDALFNVYTRMTGYDDRSDDYSRLTLIDSNPLTAPPAVLVSLSGSDLFRVNNDGLESPSPVALALDASGHVWSWGERHRFHTPHSAPTPVQGLADIVAVQAGQPYSAALDYNGNVWTWRSDANADGTRSGQQVPTQIPQLSNMLSITLMGQTGYAIRDDRTLWQWKNVDADDFSATSVTQVTGMSNAQSITAGQKHLLVLATDNSLWSMGNNVLKQLGNLPESAQRYPPEDVLYQVAYPSIGNIRQIVAGKEFNLLLNERGEIYGWGSDYAGQLGGHGEPVCHNQISCSSQLVRVNNLEGVIEIAAGSDFALARLNDGSVWGWGSNIGGQLNGLRGLSNNTPVQIPGLESSMLIRAGGDSAMAMQLSDVCNYTNPVTGSSIAARVMAWGDNGSGMRGDGTGVNWFRPTPVLGLGDDSSCEQQLGNRLIIYKSGSGSGTITSSQPGLTCSGNLCWQSVPDDTLITLSANPATGSEFAEWRWDCADATSSTQVEMSQLRHCKVIFKRTDAPVYRLQVDQVVLENGQFSSRAGGQISSQPGTIQCPGDCDDFYNENTQVALTTVNNPDYQFQYWQGTGCDNGIVNMTSDRLCTAVFAPISAPPLTAQLLIVVEGESIAGTVTSGIGGRVTTQPGGIDCPGDCSETYSSGTAVDMIAIADPGYRFAGWDATNHCSDGSVTVPTADIGCIARFIESADFTLSVTIEGGPGAGEVRSDELPIPLFSCLNSAQASTTCNTKYASGSSVTLSASSYSGGNVNWSGCNSMTTDAYGEPACVVTMTSDVQVTANFAP